MVSRLFQINLQLSFEDPLMNVNDKNPLTYVFLEYIIEY